MSAHKRRQIQVRILTLETKELPEVVQGANTPPTVLFNTHDFVQTHDVGGSPSSEGTSSVISSVIQVRRVTRSMNRRKLTHYEGC